MTSSEKPLAAHLVLKAAVAFCCCCFFCTHPSSAKLRRFERKLKHSDSLSLLAVGDWGRKGQHNQREVAQQMGKVGKELDIDWVISTGDNFYRDGLKGPKDEAFTESYINIYVAPSLQTTWYIVLGNRDYRGDVLAQLTESDYQDGRVHKSVSEEDSRWVCYRSYVVATEWAEFFFVDTTPLVKKYVQNPGPHTYDWRGVEPHASYKTNLLRDLESALKETSRSKWKIVIGHHPIKSVGEKGDTEELVQDLLPILEKNEVDIYVNGHDHCLQYILDSKSGIHFITSGGGSKTKAYREEGAHLDELKMHHGGEGFVAMIITSSEAAFKFYDGEGAVIEKYNVQKWRPTRGAFENDKITP